MSALLDCSLIVLPSFPRIDLCHRKSVGPSIAPCQTFRATALAFAARGTRPEIAERRRWVQLKGTAEGKEEL
ncbi:hypothetical protein AOLI_G00028200 [Acnodon oligacanthus]